MNIKYAITGLGIFTAILLSISASPSFGQMVETPDDMARHGSAYFLGNPSDNPATYTLTVNTIATSYNQNDTIDVSGKISPIKPGLSSVNVSIYYDGEPTSPKLIANSTASINDAGNFEQRFRLSDYSWPDSIGYVIVVQYFPGVEVDKSFQIQNPVPVAPILTHSIPLPNNATQNNGTLTTTTSQIHTNGTIPNWVKSVFGAYARGDLTDNDIIQALQFLIQQGIIKIS
jgi:hypothetical protein